MHKCIKNYELIEAGDKIAVGLSGGKDSLCLLKALSDYQKFAKEKFEVIAITVDMFNGKYDFKKLIDFCKSLNVEYHIEKSDIADIIFEKRKESNPCSLCANFRRGILNSKAKELGANKVALAHHSNDVVETFFLSMFYEGRLNVFKPKTYLSKTDITVIRPFYLVNEENIISEINNLPIFKNPCPINHKTQRENMKNIVKTLENNNKNIKKNIFNAIIETERYNLLDKN